MEVDKINIKNVFWRRHSERGNFGQVKYYSGGMEIIMVDEIASAGKFSEGETKLIKDEIFWISIYLEDERILESV